jgi:hypothetical protein
MEKFDAAVEAVNDRERFAIGGKRKSARPDCVVPLAGVKIQRRNPFPIDGRIDFDLWVCVTANRRYEALVRGDGQIGGGVVRRASIGTGARNVVKNLSRLGVNDREGNRVYVTLLGGVDFCGWARDQQLVPR